MLNTTIKLGILVLMSNGNYYPLSHFYEIIGFLVQMLQLLYIMRAYIVIQFYSYVNIVVFA